MPTARGGLREAIERASPLGSCAADGDVSWSQCRWASRISVPAWPSERCHPAQVTAREMRGQWGELTHTPHPPSGLRVMLILAGDFQPSRSTRGSARVELPPPSKSLEEEPPLRDYSNCPVPRG